MQLAKKWPEMVVKWPTHTVVTFILHQTICQDLSFLRKLRSCKFRQLFNVNEGLGLLKLANTLLILIKTSPSNIEIFSTLHAFLSDKKQMAAEFRPENQMVLTFKPQFFMLFKFCCSQLPTIQVKIFYNVHTVCCQIILEN